MTQFKGGICCALYVHRYTGRSLLKVLPCSLQDGDVWIGKCTRSTCDDGKLLIEHVQCKHVTKPKCENGQPPVKVYDERGCCFHYECRCRFKL